MAETDRPPRHAHTLVRTVIVTHGETSQLLVEIEVDCPVCGTWAFRVAGHHVASLAEAFQQIRQEHPELCGKLGERVGETSWQGGVDPGKVTLN